MSFSVYFIRKKLNKILYSSGYETGNTETGKLCGGGKHFLMILYMSLSHLQMPLSARTVLCTGIPS